MGERRPDCRSHCTLENGNLMKMLKSFKALNIVITSVTALIFMTSLYFFIESYNDFQKNSDMLSKVTAQVRLARKQHTKQEKEKRILSNVEHFVKRSNQLGLKEDNWASYEVNIEEKLFLAELETIMAQTKNTNSYYFKPQSLLLRQETDDETGTKKTAKQMKSKEEDDVGDLYVSLSGAFIVRQK